MDLREKKTRRSIANAFLKLRSQKPLERITVKELAELAEISKATFYLHYRDVYDLSDALQEEVIQSILSGLTHPEYFHEDRTAFLFELVNGFYAQQNLIETLFSGNQAGVLPLRVEKELRAYLHRILPETGAEADMLLTYQIQGSFSVYQTYYKDHSMEQIIRFLGAISQITGGVNLPE